MSNVEEVTLMITVGAVLVILLWTSDIGQCAIEAIASICSRSAKSKVRKTQTSGYEPKIDLDPPKLVQQGLGRDNFRQVVFRLTPEKKLSNGERVAGQHAKGPIMEESSESAWREILIEENGVMLVCYMTGNQIATSYGSRIFYDVDLKRQLLLYVLTTSGDLYECDVHSHKEFGTEEYIGDVAWSSTLKRQRIKDATLEKPDGVYLIKYRVGDHPHRDAKFIQI